MNLSEGVWVCVGAGTGGRRRWNRHLQHVTWEQSMTVTVLHINSHKKAELRSGHGYDSVTITRFCICCDLTELAYCVSVS